MKGQIRSINVKYLWLSLNTSWALLFFIHTCICPISRITNVIKENEICLPEKEYVSGHR